MPIQILNRGSFNRDAAEEAAGVAVAHDASVIVAPTALIATAIGTANNVSAAAGNITHGQDLTLSHVGLAGAGITTANLTTVDPGIGYNLDQNFVNTYSSSVDPDGVPVFYRLRFADGRHAASKSYAGPVRFRECMWDGQINDRALGGQWDFEFCEWDISPQGGGAFGFGPVNASSGRMYRNHLKGWGIGPVMGGTYLIEECYFHIMCPVAGQPDPHQSGGNLQFNASSGFIMRRCKWIADRATESAETGVSGVFVCYNDATHTNASWIDNYMAGGAYILNVSYDPGRTGAQQSGFTVSGNKWGRELARFGGFQGTLLLNGTGHTISGNVWGPRGPFWQAGDPEEGDPY